MNEKIRMARGPMLSMLLGALITVIGVPLAVLGWQQVYILYDRANPPVVAKLATYKMVNPEVLHIRMYVTRQEDCEFLKLQGFSGKTLELMEPAMASRVDKGEPISYPKDMTILSAAWEIKPIIGPRLRVYGYYDCNNRPVKTLLVDETLK